MKKILSTLPLVLFAGVSLLAYGKSQPLADTQMDRISAGSAIANGESSATDSREFEVELSGSSLSGASGIDIVNAVNSTVGDLTNTWSGDHMTNATAVTQVNVLAQTGVPCDCLFIPGADVAATAHGGADPEIEADVALGDAIALDGSKAENKFEEEVELSGSAESNAKALNIVNASGSIVGNEINTASSTNMNNLTALTQVNTLVQIH